VFEDPEDSFTGALSFAEGDGDGGDLDTFLFVASDDDG
jgi:hypothetical protein